jgi:flagellar protein FliO/FliZ
MDFAGVLRAVFSLAVVLGLIVGVAFLLRRYAPQLLARLEGVHGHRRLKVVETLVLDPARRLILVRLDNEERLILLGEGRELLEPRDPPPPEPVRETVLSPRPPAPGAAPLSSKVRL